MPHTTDEATIAATTSASDRAGHGKWIALTAALLGWMFDGFEMGMFPLVGPRALDELLKSQIAIDPTVKDKWFGLIMATFLIGAASGGVLFGWLGDRLGRVRAMGISIFVYAIFTGLCGVTTEAWQLAVLRFIASLGMGGEWALGVALVTEVWPDGSRAMLAGLIGAASNVGFLAIALLSLVLLSVLGAAQSVMLAVHLPDAVVETLLRGDGWRLVMMAGAIPAVLTYFIFRFVPESRRWEEERQSGRVSNMATRDLLGVFTGLLGAGAVVWLWAPIPHGPLDANLGAWRTIGTLLGIAVAMAGFMYPVLRYLNRAVTAGMIQKAQFGTTLRRLILGACLAGVALLGTWGSIQWAPKWALALDKAGGSPHAHVKEYTQICMATGAIVSTVLAALVAGACGRRITYTLLCLGSMASVVLLYQTNNAYGPAFLACVTLAAGATAAFYGWFPLYFPELFNTSVRASAQGFAYNFGRVLAAIGTLQTAALTTYFSEGVPKEFVETAAFAKAGTVLSLIYLVGASIVWLGPETKGRPLPE
jgi:SHS family sialic acid transporter-like MFS transporter